VIVFIFFLVASLNLLPLLYRQNILSAVLVKDSRHAFYLPITRDEVLVELQGGGCGGLEGLILALNAP
jgi:hypothetical protein